MAGKNQTTKNHAMKKRFNWRCSLVVNANRMHCVYIGSAHVPRFIAACIYRFEMFWPTITSCTPNPMQTMIANKSTEPNDNMHILKSINRNRFV